MRPGDFGPVTLRRWKVAVFALSLVPFAWMIADGFADALGANPVEEITHRTGRWALRFLLVTLAITPLRRLTGWNGLMRFRRMLGLFAFFYACVHFGIYAVLDASFDFAHVLEDVLERPYITVGFTVLCLLLPLAVTSTNAMVRRLGGKRWRRLHRLVYVAAAGGVLHFIWQVKADYREPLIYYLSILLVLLLLRVPSIATRLSSLRQPVSRSATDTRQQATSTR